MRAGLASVSHDADVDQFARFADGIFFGGRPSFRSRYPVAFSPENGRNIVLARDGDAIVAGAVGYRARLRLAPGCALETLAIGAVCTREDYRGRGLSAQVLGALREQAVADGAHLLLISGTGPLYQRLGGRQVGRLHEVHVSRAFFPERAPGYQRHTSPEPTSVDLAWAASEGAVVGFDRSREEFERLLTGALFPFSAETAALLVPDRQAGYAVVRTGMEGSERVGFLVEHAGDTEVMLAIALDEARRQNCDRFYTRLTASPPAPWSTFSTPIAITGVLAFADAERAVDAIVNHLHSHAGIRLDVGVVGGEAVVSLDGTVLFAGAVAELLDFFWGVPATAGASPPWLLPSFRTDTLNFL